MSPLKGIVASYHMKIVVLDFLFVWWIGLPFRLFGQLGYAHDVEIHIANIVVHGDIESKSLNLFDVIIDILFLVPNISEESYNESLLSS